MATDTRIIGEEEERAIQEGIKPGERPPEPPPPEREPYRGESDEPTEGRTQERFIAKQPARIPEDAEVTERHGRTGNPTVYEKGGVRYYTPESTMYKKGFRTDTEFKEARKIDADFGPHEGRLVPEGAVGYRSGGKLIGRWPPEKFAKRPKDLPDVKETKTGRVMTVTGKGGGTVILSGKDIKRYNEADTPAKKLRIAKELYLVPVSTTLKQFTERYDDSGVKKQAAADFTVQQETKRFKKLNIQLPDGQWIDKEYLAGIKKTNPELHDLFTKSGYAAGAAYIQEANKKYGEFIASHTQLPDLQWISNSELMELRKKNPAALKSLVMGGFDGYQDDLNDAYSVLKPYESKRYPPTGEYELTRAMLRNKPEIKEAADLLFGRDVIDSIYSEYPHLRPGYTRAPRQVTAIPTKTHRLFNLKPELAALLPVALAEPTPIGELALLIAAGGTAAYIAYKGTREEKVIPAVVETGRKMEAKLGRPLTKNDINTDLIAPSVLTFELERDIIEKLGPKPHKTRLPQREDYIEGDIVEKLIPLKSGDLPALPPMEPVRNMPKGSPPTSIVTDLPKGAPPTSTGAQITTNVFKAAVDVREAEKTLAPIVKPLEVGKYLPATIPQTTTALVALDKAVNDAFARGDIDESDMKSYYKARAKYLEKLGIYSQAMGRWIGGNQPQLKELDLRQLAALADTYQTAYQRAISDGATTTKAQTAAQTKTLTRLKTMVKTATTTQTATKTATKAQAATQTAAQTATRTATQTATQTATDRAAARPAEAARVADRTTTRPLRPGIPPVLPLPKGGSTKKKEWTAEEIKSAIAWQSGFVVHAIKSPYRRGIDEKSFHIDNVPPGLKILRSRGRGTAQRTVKVTGQLKKPVTIDVGNQDVVVTPMGNRQARITHRRDTTGTVSATTISKKRGRINRTRIGGDTVLSRRPIKGY